MGRLGNLLKLITYKENPDKEGFVLTETESEKSASRQPKDDENARRSAKRQPSDNTASRSRIKASFSRRLGIKSKNIKTKPNSNGGEKTNNNVNQRYYLTSSLEKNREALKELYRLPLNIDVEIRDFALGTVPPVRGFVIYINSITNKQIQNMLFQALMIFSAETPNPGVNRLAALVSERLLPGSSVEICDNFRAVLDAVNDGDTVIFLEGLDRAIAVDTRGFTNRNIEKPTIEQAIRAPQEGFGETLRNNLSLVRKHFRNENLVTERLKVGYRNRANVGVMYVHGLINPELVAEVKRRISSIQTDLVNESGILEQFIEDYPYSLLPQVLATERPDRVIAAEKPGHPYRDNGRRGGKDRRGCLYRREYCSQNQCKRGACSILPVI